MSLRLDCSDPRTRTHRRVPGDKPVTTGDNGFHP